MPNLSLVSCFLPVPSGDVYKRQALGVVWMAVGSMGLELPLTQGDPATEGTRVSANLLISTSVSYTHLPKSENLKPSSGSVATAAAEASSFLSITQ